MKVGDEMTWPAKSRIATVKQNTVPCAASSIARQECDAMQGHVVDNSSGGDMCGAGGKLLNSRSAMKTRRVHYPSHFDDFDWWKSGFYQKRKEWEEAKLKCIEERCPKSLDIPVPTVPKRYPYRYSSAGPSTTGRTQREWDMRRAYLKCCPKKFSDTKAGEIKIREIFQPGGYETTTLSESLKPFQQVIAKSERVPNLPLGKSLLEPTYAPWVATSEFDRYMIDTLHPGWHTDPLYRRRVVYKYYPVIPDGHA